MILEREGHRRRSARVFGPEVTPQDSLDNERQVNRVLQGARATCQRNVVSSGRSSRLGFRRAPPHLRRMPS